jgi:hypothetical protein
MSTGTVECFDLCLLKVSMLCLPSHSTVFESDKVMVLDSALLAFIYPEEYKQSLYLFGMIQCVWQSHWLSHPFLTFIFLQYFSCLPCHYCNFPPSIFNILSFWSNNKEHMGRELGQWCQWLPSPRRVSPFSYCLWWDHTSEVLSLCIKRFVCFLRYHSISWIDLQNASVKYVLLWVPVCRHKKSKFTSVGYAIVRNWICKLSY